MNEAPNWTLSLGIIAVVVVMAFVPLLPLAGWKLEQWWKARQKQREGDGQSGL